MGIVIGTAARIMSSFNLISVVFGLFSVAYLCEATLKEDFCTDVSFWDVIKYTSTTAECCDTVLKEDCITKNERVCEDATEIKCNTVGWAECTTKFPSKEVPRDLQGLPLQGLQGGEVLRAAPQGGARVPHCHQGQLCH